jgi:putative DNA primase/helicase
MMTKPRVVVDNTPWKDKLQISSTGSARPNLYNACICFRDAPEFRGRLAFNEFSLETMIIGALPWSSDINRTWTKHDDNMANVWAQKQDLNIGLQIVEQAIETVAFENKYHPLRTWLRSLQWDGTPRIDDWLTYYVGADRSPYVQTVGKAWLISAVARVMQPGCKADHVLIFEGRQGLRKSSALRVLAGPDWYTDEMAEMGSKDAGLQMRGVWIIELAELDHLKSGETNRIKAFVSRSTDRFRPPYGHRLVKSPRECVFAGTVNHAEYLKDDTGNRRFWPVAAGEAIDLEALENDRDQIWAEALACYDAGDPWWITDNTVETIARSVQEERREGDPWTETISAWLHDASFEKITATELLVKAVGKRIGDITQKDSERVGSIMRTLGWKRGAVRMGGVVVKGFRRDDA